MAQTKSGSTADHMRHKRMVSHGREAATTRLSLTADHDVRPASQVMKTAGQALKDEER
jgi:hypothetical protein